MGHQHGMVHDGAIKSKLNYDGVPTSPGLGLEGSALYKYFVSDIGQIPCKIENHHLQRDRRDSG